MDFFSDPSSVRPFLAFGLLGLLLIVEWWIPFRAPAQSKLRHTGTNLTIAGTNTVVIYLLFNGPLLFLSQKVQTEGWGVLNYLNMGLWENLLLSVIIFDLLFYGVHWANHRVPFLWRFHRAHHSDLTMDVTTAFRFHIGEVLISTGMKAGGVLALGVSPMGIVMFEMALLAAAQFQHSNLGLPPRLDTWLRLMIVTPHMHWIHHSQRSQEHNFNFGTIFTIWDRVFRTLFIQRPQTDITIGLGEYSTLEQVGLREFYMMPVRGRCQSGTSGF